MENIWTTKPTSPLSDFHGVFLVIKNRKSPDQLADSGTPEESVGRIDTYLLIRGRRGSGSLRTPQEETIKENTARHLQAGRKYQPKIVPDPVACEGFEPPFPPPYSGVTSLALDCRPASSVEQAKKNLFSCF